MSAPISPGDLSAPSATGFLPRTPIVDLLDIADPAGISLPPRAGDFGLGTQFKFPFQTIEDVLPIGDDRLLVLNDNNFQWSRTGHLSVRQSVIDSSEFAALPHRSSYANTAQVARSMPQTQNQRGVYNAMITDFNGMWLTGSEPQAALDAAQAGVERILRRNR